MNPKICFLSMVGFGALTLAACGYTDAGDGTRTLDVTAILDYAVTDDNKMKVSISVKKGGQPLNNATVELTDAETDTRFVVTQGGTGDEYNRIGNEDSILGYHRRLALHIDSGGDRLDAQLEGPSSHIIVSPANNESIAQSSVGSFLKVEWTTTDGLAAEEVEIRVGGHGNGFEETLRDYEDPGEFELPSSELEINESNDIRVTRRNRVTLDGGVGGSKMEISYEVKNTIVIQP